MENIFFKSLNKDGIDGLVKDSVKEFLTNSDILNFRKVDDDLRVSINYSFTIPIFEDSDIKEIGIYIESNIVTYVRSILYKIFINAIDENSNNIVSISDRRLKIKNLLGSKVTKNEMLFDEIYNTYSEYEEVICFVSSDVFIYPILNRSYYAIDNISIDNYKNSIVNFLGKIRDVEVYQLSNYRLNQYCFLFEKEFISFYIDDDFVTWEYKEGDIFSNLKINIKLSYFNKLKILKIIKYV